MNTNDKTIRIAETAVGLADTFYTSKQHNEFYQRCGPRLGGFPGIWAFIAHTAVAIEARLGARFEADELPWIETLDAIGTAILELSADEVGALYIESSMSAFLEEKAKSLAVPGF